MTVAGAVYIEVDEEYGTELFYYFVESEGDSSHDPIILWLTGGDRCSVLSGLAFEIGPFKFVVEPYDGGVPRLQYNPYTWTKVASIIFVDWPVGAGFSFSRITRGYDVGFGDIPSTQHLKKFLTKWFDERPEYLANPFYIGADSIAGKISSLDSSPIPTYRSGGGGREEVAMTDRERATTLDSNPATGEIIDTNSRVPFAHGLGIISDQIYERIMWQCQGEDYTHPKEALCGEALASFNYIFDHVISKPHVLYPRCIYASPNPNYGIASRNILMEEMKLLHNPPPRPSINCMSYGPYLSYYWANNDATRDALGIKKHWRVAEVPRDIKSSIEYHRNVTSKGYRSLVYSGDHDIVIPFPGTQTWVRSLNFSIVDDWRAWHVDGQSAGFTISYSNNMTFATIKDGGHTAPEYQPERCFAMIQRWISGKPL
ncbi:hypothetical protein EJB05_28141, partial [Eragrostis curvula]